MSDRYDEIVDEFFPLGMCLITLHDVRSRCASAIRKAVEEEREECAKACEAEAKAFLSPEYSTGQPFSSLQERFGCTQCASAIRSRTTSPENPQQKGME